MIYFWSIFFFLLFLYCLLIIAFSISWGNEKMFIPLFENHKDITSVSVIVALRNEEENLPKLINALSKQTFPNSSFEVILVNDHSTDNTYNLLVKLAQKYSWLRPYQLSKNKFGKKEALQLGISKAKSELLAFTDGDCLPPTTWLSTLSQYYIAENKPDFIIGMVDLFADSGLKKVFRLEFLSLVLSSAGAAALGHPILCNGANLAIKASVIKTYSQNTSITSGDDVFLLHYIKKQGGRINLLKSHQHLMSTSAPGSFASFFGQRKRWASKTKYYGDIDTIVVALLVFTINAALLSATFLGVYFNSFDLVLVAFGLKAIADLFLFLKGADLYNYKKQLWRLPFISIAYPFYITLTALTAIKKPFTWKGRKYSK